VVAWLFDHRMDERAHELLDLIVPFFDRVRFYPVPDAPAIAATPSSVQHPIRVVRLDLNLASRLKVSGPELTLDRRHNLHSPPLRIRLSCSGLGRFFPKSYWLVIRTNSSG
jgi:hypothetical protein